VPTKVARHRPSACADARHSVPRKADFQSAHSGGHPGSNYDEYICSPCAISGLGGEVLPRLCRIFQGRLKSLSSGASRQVSACADTTCGGAARQGRLINRPYLAKADQWPQAQKSVRVRRTSPLQYHQELRSCWFVGQGFPACLDGLESPSVSPDHSSSLSAAHTEPGISQSYTSFNISGTRIVLVFLTPGTLPTTSVTKR